MHKSPNLIRCQAQLSGKASPLPRQPFTHDRNRQRAENDLSASKSTKKKQFCWSAAAISERLVLPEQLIDQTTSSGSADQLAQGPFNLRSLPIGPTNHPASTQNNIQVYRKRPQLCGLVPADPVPYGSSHTFPDAVVVVEGQRDLEAVRASINCSVFILGGGGNFHSKHPTLHALYALDRMHPHLIVFTDPDPAGRLMRHCIDSQLGPVMHAFLPAHLGLLRTRQGHRQLQFPVRPKVGIEHATPESIATALAGRRRTYQGRKHFISEDLISFGMPVPSKRNQRTQWLRLLGCALGFGAVGRKAELLHCLNTWCFSREEVEAAMKLAQEQIYKPFLNQR